jgi:hypothetical protein
MGMSGSNGRSRFTILTLVSSLGLDAAAWFQAGSLFPSYAPYGPLARPGAHRSPGRRAVEGRKKDGCPLSHSVGENRAL